MVDGTMTFTVDNGRGPITAIFKPNDRFNFCDGKWHEIHAVKVRILNPGVHKLPNLLMIKTTIEVYICNTSIFHHQNKGKECCDPIRG